MTASFSSKDIPSSNSFKICKWQAVPFLRRSRFGWGSKKQKHKLQFGTNIGPT
jgi:hypothetical protein